MSNSKLISHVKISPNRNSPRTRSVKGIAIHCMAGQLTVESCGELFAKSSRQASSNYGIGKDGRIGMYVEEKDRSWCTSTYLDNDVVTIECASDSFAPYKINDAVYKSLIVLCADICRRNGIPKLLWQNDKSLIGQWDRQNIILHRWFKNKACPGQYIEDHLPDIVAKVNLALGQSDGNTALVGTGIGEALCISNDPMAVRSGTTIFSTKQGEVKKGQKVEVLDILQSGWMKIVWPGALKGYAWTSNVQNRYYIVTKYVKPYKAKVVNCDFLNVRSTPDSSNKSNIVAQLKVGAEVIILGTSGEWLRIDKGFIYSNYVKKA